MHVTDRFNSIQKTEFPFTLPRAYLDPEGNLHHEGGRGHATCHGIRRNRAHEGAPCPEQSGMPRRYSLLGLDVVGTRLVAYVGWRLAVAVLPLN